MVNLVVSDNLVVMEDRVVAVFKIEPIDYLILSNQDKSAFEMNIKKLFNGLDKEYVQLIMKTRKAVPSDLNLHFKDLRTQEVSFKKTKKIRERLLDGYVDQLNYFLESSIIPIKEYYVVLKVSVNPKNAKKLMEAVKTLDKKARKVMSGLGRSGIETEQVVNDENKSLDKFVASFLRI